MREYYAVPLNFNGHLRKDNLEIPLAETIDMFKKGKFSILYLGLLLDVISVCTYLSKEDIRLWMVIMSFVSQALPDLKPCWRSKILCDSKLFRIYNLHVMQVNDFDLRKIFKKPQKYVCSILYYLLNSFCY